MMTGKGLACLLAPCPVSLEDWTGVKHVFFFVCRMCVCLEPCVGGWAGFD